MLLTGWQPLLPNHESTDAPGSMKGIGESHVSAQLRQLRMAVAKAQAELREVEAENEKMAAVIREATSLQATTGHTGMSP